MCGLVVALSSAMHSKYVWSFVDSQLSLRGPDAVGSYISNGLEFSYFRLIVRGDSSSGTQPCVIDRYAMVFNGNMTNTQKLCEKFNIEYTVSDKDVIPRLFHLIGKRIFEELNGFFAIVILDKKIGELVLYTLIFWVVYGTAYGAVLTGKIAYINRNSAITALVFAEFEANIRY